MKRIAIVVLLCASLVALPVQAAVKVQPVFICTMIPGVGVVCAYVPPPCPALPRGAYCW